MTTVTVPDNGGGGQTPVTLDDASMFSSAMADEAPAQQPAPAQAEPEPQLQPDTATQPRDEHGRFAAKAGETTAAPAQPSTEPAPQAQPAAVTAPQPEPSVPPGRLKEEADARRAAEARAMRLEQQLGELMTRLPRPEAPKPAPAPDFFENPDAAMQHVVQSLVAPQLGSVQKTLDDFGRMIAGQVHTAEKVQAAEQAFIDGYERRTLDPADYHRVMNAPNRYDAVVQWHKRQTALQTIGNETPEAWAQKWLGEQMKNPQFQAQMIEQLRGSVQQPANGTRPPSTVQLPPSLSRVTAAAPNTPDDSGDMSDQSLYRHAMR